MNSKSDLGRQQPSLLFLYPRWFASAVAAPQTADSRNDVTNTKTEHTVASQADQITQVNEYHIEEAGRSGTTRIPLSSVKPLNTRPTRRLVRSALGRIKGKEEIRRKAFRSKLNTSDALDWKAVLETLEKDTPVELSYTWKHIRYVHFDTNVDELYEGDLRQFILSLLLLTECLVQVLPTSGNVLVLTGDFRAIRRALDRLRQAFSDPRLIARAVEQGETNGQPDGDMTNHGSDGTSPRAVFSNDYHWLELAKRGLVNVPRPVADQPWNVISFAQWVEVLTLSRPARLQAMAARKAGSESGEIPDIRASTSQKLVKAYENREVLHYASTYSVVHTFQYLARERKFPEIRRIFHSLDEVHFHITASAFDAMLHAAAMAQDLHNFRFVLNLMLARQVKPTWQSWANLIYLVSKRSVTDAHMIRKRMQASNLLLNPAAQKSVAAILAKDDFQQWLDDGKDGRQFLAHYDQMFGSGDWLTAEAVNALVEIRATRGQFSAIGTLLDEFDARKCKPNVVTLNIILTLGARQGNTRAAIILTSRLLLPEYRIYPNAITYDQLFNLAWHRRSLNLVRAVWRSACLAGHVSDKMARTIRNSVVAFPPSGTRQAAKEVDRPSRNQVFRAVAGKLAVGISHNALTRADPVVPDAEHWLLRHATESEADVRDARNVIARRNRLKEVYKADLAQFGKLLPALSLQRMLEEAMELDTVWKQNRSVNDPEKMFAAAIKVPVTRKFARDREDHFVDETPWSDFPSALDTPS
ncbi:hypothetical protein MBLNU457_1425t1 [Dothideomycetes sp. NU457]